MKLLRSIFIFQSIFLISFIELNLFHQLNAFNNIPFWLSLPSALTNTWNILSNIIPFAAKDHQTTQQQQQQQCPFGQIHRCRCENFLNLQQKSTDPKFWQILQQSNETLSSQEQEIWAILNNGLVIYHKYTTNQETPDQVLYALRLYENNYFAIHFNITKDQLRLGKIPKDFVAAVIVIPPTLITTTENTPPHVSQIKNLNVEKLL